MVSDCDDGGEPGHRGLFVRCGEVSFVACLHAKHKQESIDTFNTGLSHQAGQELIELMSRLGLVCTFESIAGQGTVVIGDSQPYMVGEIDQYLLILHSCVFSRIVGGLIGPLPHGLFSRACYPNLGSFALHRNRWLMHLLGGQSKTGGATEVGLCYKESPFGNASEWHLIGGCNNAGFNTPSLAFPELISRHTASLAPVRANKYSVVSDCINQYIRENPASVMAEPIMVYSSISHELTILWDHYRTLWVGLRYFDYSFGGCRLGDCDIVLAVGRLHMLSHVVARGASWVYADVAFQSGMGANGILSRSEVRILSKLF